MNITEEQHVNAVYRLGTMRERHRDLGRAEARAKVELAAAIIAWDNKREICEAAQAAGENPRPHDLQEQATVEAALQTYGQVLADLLRGETA